MVCVEREIRERGKKGMDETYICIYILETQLQAATRKSPDTDGRAAGHPGA